MTPPQPPLSSYPFQSPQAQQSSSSSTPQHHHDPYSQAPHHYAPYPSHPELGSEASQQQRRSNYDDEQIRSDEIVPPEPFDYYDAPKTLGAYRNLDNDNYLQHNRSDQPQRYADASRMSSEKVVDPYDDGNVRHGNSIWTKDDKRAFAERSAPAKICRFLIGNLIIGIIFVLAIVCLIVMFLRPPNVGITGVSVPSQNAVSYSNGAFSFNVSVDISISNPNSISASIKKLTATAYDSSDQSTALGYGSISNAKIQKNANTTIVFPFQIKYNQSQDTDLSIIRNIASDCGLSLTGGSSASGDLSFLFKIDVTVDFLSVGIPVSIDKNISFPCPLSGSSLSSVLGGLSSSLGGLKREVVEEAKARLARRVDSVNAIDWKRDLNPAQLVAAAADAWVKRQSGGSQPAQPLAKRLMADLHDAL